MMFGQYLILGAWAVPFASFLLTSPDRGGLGFSPTQTSWIYSATAIAALLAPLMLGLLADRLFATQRLLGVLHFVGAAVLYGSGRFCAEQQAALRESGDPAGDNQWTFAVLLVLMLANAMITILTLSLCNVTGFRNLREPKRSYGRIRMYGTLGWILVNLAIDMLGEPMSAQPLYIAAIGSLVMGFYSFTLPHTPPAKLGKGIAEALGVPALKMFRMPGFRILILSGLCLAAVQQFYAVYGNPYLRALGAAKPSALQTLAQVFEILCLMTYPLVLLRYGFKVTLAIGVFGWVIRNALFATGWLQMIAIVGLPLHGMCFTFFFLVCNVYVDRHAPPHLRASAQGILTFTVGGIGALLGNFMSAEVLEASTADTGVSWTWFWLAPCAASALVFLLFVTLFQEDQYPSTSRTVVEPPRVTPTAG
jgi:nucleoside transporter